MKILDSTLYGIKKDTIQLKPENLILKMIDGVLLTNDNKPISELELKIALEFGLEGKALFSYKDTELSNISECEEMHLLMDLEDENMDVTLFTTVEQDFDEYDEWCGWDIEFSVAEKIMLHNLVEKEREKYFFDKVRKYVQKKLLSVGYFNFSLTSDHIEENKYTGDFISDNMRINITVLVEDISDIENPSVDQLVTILEYSYSGKSIA